MAESSQVITNSDGHVSTITEFIKSTGILGIVGLVLGGMAGARFTLYRHQALISNPDAIPDLNPVSRYLFVANVDTGTIVVAIVGAILGWLLFGIVWRKFNS